MTTAGVIAASLPSSGPGALGGASFTSASIQFALLLAELSDEAENLARTAASAASAANDALTRGARTFNAGMGAYANGVNAAGAAVRGVASALSNPEPRRGGDDGDDGEADESDSEFEPY